MAQKRLLMDKVRKIVELHFGEACSARKIATNCGVSRRSVAQTLKRFAASGLDWSAVAEMDDTALDEALYPSRGSPQAGEAVDWEAVEKALSGRGVTLKLLWEEWRRTHPDGMSYVTWCRHFKSKRRCPEVTMRQNRRPGERLFVDYAGMTAPVLIDGEAHHAQLFVAAMGVSGWIYAEATLSQKIDDWCHSHIRCFERMGFVPKVVVPDNVKAAVTSPSRYEPVLNATYADLLKHYGVLGLPARVRKPRDKGLVENAVLLVERRVLAPLRDHVFYDLVSLNRAIAVEVQKVNAKPYTDGSGESRFDRFESVDTPYMKPLPVERWQRTLWRKNKVHTDYHIAIDYHLYSVPFTYVGKEVNVRQRGQMIDVFYGCEHIASHMKARKGHGRRATTIDEHMPKGHQRAKVEATRERIETRARNVGANVFAFVTMIMERNHNPEFGFRSCYGVLRLAGSHAAERFDGACRFALDNGTDTYRGLDNILRTNSDLVDEEEAESHSIDHSNIRGPEYYK